LSWSPLIGLIIIFPPVRKLIWVASGCDISPLSKDG
jgi:UPF0716 family protein affecting phage T7 exclusion